MNTNLDFHQKKNLRLSVNKIISPSPVKSSLHNPMKLHVGGNMIGRVHHSNPGCGSCGK
jgi:hypothetical protein